MMKKVFSVFVMCCFMSNYIACSSERPVSISILGVSVNENHIPGSRSLSPSLTAIIDFNELDHHGNTSLHKAIEENNIAAVKILLGLGANPDVENAMRVSSYSFAFWRYQENPNPINKEILALVHQYKAKKKS